MIPDLSRYQISDPRVAAMLDDGDLAGAVSLARDRVRTAGQATAREPLAIATCDLAGALLAGGAPFPDAALLLQQAVNLAPQSRIIFHNLASALYRHRALNARNLRMLSSILALAATAPWRAQYRSLLMLPTFLNFQFVSGKCNLKCRMCVGTNSPHHPGKLSYIDADRFAEMLDAVPSVQGITLSSSDSDPLLHPQLERVLQIAGARGATLDIYTNGLPMGERVRRAIVKTGSVSMLNISIDAATAATYVRVRGGDLSRVHANIRALLAAKAEAGRELPHLSLSFVAMADTIEELPEFVRQARDFKAGRVFVGDLIGWRGEDGRGDGGNHPATDHPEWPALIVRARQIADEAGILLLLPERLSRAPGSDAIAAAPGRTDNTSHDPLTSPGPSSARTEHERLPACGWLNGVWVNRDGSLHPCCLIQNVADMGTIADGPLDHNPKYARVKTLLARGKVFDACRGQRMCQFVQQQEAAGVPLRVISQSDLGDLAPGTGPTPIDADAPNERTVPLPVLGAA